MSIEAEGPPCGGPIDLIRRKLAREPQIHGGKKSRVVFTDDGEKSVPRDDRH
ncbi:MAG: hypothetical protein OXN86_00160 [Chloroflexota bacterium]|nr:hypothetical protein [Chloroflexota bacterium]